MGVGDSRPVQACSRDETAGYSGARLVAWLAAAALMVVLSSCAKQAAPPGGPVDKTAPKLVESEPAAGTRGFPVTGSIRLVFSEKLDKRSLEKGLWVNPRIRGGRPSCSGAVVTLAPLDSLYADTTYVVTLGAAVQDRRSNRIGIPVAIGFSTGPNLDESALVGRVLRSGKSVAGAGVLLYVWKDGREADPEVDVPYRQTETDPDGNFVLPFLRPVSRGYELFAFLDQNRTGAFEEGDPSGFYPEPVSVAAFPDTIGGIEIEVWDSRKTGLVMGCVLGDWDPEFPVWVEASVPGDSTVARSTRISRPGPFRMGGVPAGKYFLSVFQDMNGDGQWDTIEDLPEPRVTVADTLEVEAGAVVRDVEILREMEEE
ncbi:MAG: Ig-like domain-containing protein [Candidatus Eisenbacteria sp.]|nr:Ig-like domain-containing protein [Candidatus Eisenbacteria bacterium]